MAATGVGVATRKRGDCSGNAVIESFFYTLKVERVNWQSYATRCEAEEDINRWIGMWYNQRRLHSSLGRVSTIEYEKGKKKA